jgi:hypothetical protein
MGGGGCGERKKLFSPRLNPVPLFPAARDLVRMITGQFVQSMQAVIAKDKLGARGK